MPDSPPTATPLPATSWSQRGAYGLLLAVLCGGSLLLASGADVAERTAGLRLWTLVAAGLFAMTPSNLLLPDPNTRLLQLMNWPPSRLLRYQLGRLGPLLVLVTLPAVTIAFASPDNWTDLLHDLETKTLALGQALLLMMGAAADSFAHFATLGPRSQAWQEEQAGQWYGRAVEERGQGVSLPRGLVPALFATTRCFVVSLAAILMSAAGAQSGLWLTTWGPGAILLGWAGVRLWRQRRVYDRQFYHTTAFYDEVMGGGGPHTAGRDPIPYNALYWVPSRWRPATWAGLRQLDRRLPLGRLVALAHAGLWLLCIRGVGSGLVPSYLLIVFLAQTATCGVLATSATAPLHFQRPLQSAADWIGTRTFVNLRWLAAHAGSLTLIATFDDTYGTVWVLTWAAVHVGLSLTTATVTTLAHEGWGRFRKETA